MPLCWSLRRRSRRRWLPRACSHTSGPTTNGRRRGPSRFRRSIPRRCILRIRPCHPRTSKLIPNNSCGGRQQAAVHIPAFLLSHPFLQYCRRFHALHQLLIASGRRVCWIYKMPGVRSETPERGHERTPTHCNLLPVARFQRGYRRNPFLVWRITPITTHYRAHDLQGQRNFLREVLLLEGSPLYH
jgi:hypothetical protein